MTLFTPQEEIEGRAASRFSISTKTKVAAGCVIGATAIYATSQTISYKIASCCLAASASSVAFIGLYVVKSALGIDLMPGESFMHDSFYFF